MTKQLAITDYKTILKTARGIIAHGRRRAEEAVTQIAAETYWELGKFVVVEVLLNAGRAPKGKRIVQALADDLDIGYGELKKINQFYRTYPKGAPGLLLSWSHYKTLITIEDTKERVFYECEAAREKWGKRELRKRVKEKGYSAKSADHKARPVDWCESPVTAKKKLRLMRGKPGYYNVSRDPEKGWVRIDLGFHIFKRASQGSIRLINGAGMVCRADSGFENISAKPEELYTFPAVVTKVIDGDTLWCDIDCGLETGIAQKLRLRGIDTAELGTAEGEKAKQYVESIFSNNKHCVIKTYKEEKFGRYLTDVFYVSAGKVESRADKTAPETIPAQGVFLNQELLDKGLAVRV